MRSNEKLKTEMYAFVRRWERSGLNQKEFCKTEGINYYKFKYWKTRQYQEQKTSQPKSIEPASVFTPVTVPGLENTFPGLEITFPNGVKLSFKQGLEVHQLKEFIKLF